ncbi:hypothetical protein RYX36_001053 [Vicia faba]
MPNSLQTCIYTLLHPHFTIANFQSKPGLHVSILDHTNLLRLNQPCTCMFRLNNPIEESIAGSSPFMNTSHGSPKQFVTAHQNQSPSTKLDQSTPLKQFIALRITN